MTIYECPVHGVVRPVDGACGVKCWNGGRMAPCRQQPRRLRVFREEDVRPLWEALSIEAGSDHYSRQANNALTAFPAPEWWKP